MAEVITEDLVPLRNRCLHSTERLLGLEPLPWYAELSSCSRVSDHLYPHIGSSFYGSSNLDQPLHTPTRSRRNL